MRNYIIAIFVLGMFISCENHYFINSYSFSDGWNKKDALNFDFEVDETSVYYEIQFTVRNNNDYPFRNIILFTELEGIKDTLDYDLAEKDGRWLGHGFGAEKELTLEFKKNYQFKDKGAKSLKVTQAMRKDTLYGITDFSVIINKNN